MGVSTHVRNVTRENTNRSLFNNSCVNKDKLDEYLMRERTLNICVLVCENARQRACMLLCIFALVYIVVCTFRVKHSYYRSTTLDLIVSTKLETSHLHKINLQ